MRGFAHTYTDILGQNLFPTNVTTLEETDLSVQDNALVCLGLENVIGIQAQFLYLYLLAGKRPFMARRYTSKKSLRFSISRMQTVKISCFLRWTRSSYLTKMLFNKFMPKQLSPKFPAIKLSSKYTKIIAWNAPLYEKTNGVLTSQNVYMSEVPVFYKFRTAGSLTEETSFWLKFCKFLRINPTSLASLSLESYDYEEIYRV